MFPFDPPKNIRKPLVSGGSKGNIGKKWVKVKGFLAVIVKTNLF